MHQKKLVNLYWKQTNRISDEPLSNVGWDSDRTNSRKFDRTFPNTRSDTRFSPQHPTATNPRFIHTVAPDAPHAALDALDAKRFCPHTFGADNSLCLPTQLLDRHSTFVSATISVGKRHGAGDGAQSNDGYYLFMP